MITGTLNTLAQNRKIAGRYEDNTYGGQFIERLSDEVVFFDNTATATGTAGNYFGGWAETAVIFINVTAVSGTSPTCTVTLNSIDFESGGSYPLATSSSITAAGFYYIQVPVVYRDTFSVTYTLGGTTPSFTMSISGVFKG